MLFLATAGGLLTSRTPVALDGNKFFSRSSIKKFAVRLGYPAYRCIWSPDLAQEWCGFTSIELLVLVRGVLCKGLDDG